MIPCKQNSDNLINSEVEFKTVREFWMLFYLCYENVSVRGDKKTWGRHWYRKGYFPSARHWRRLGSHIIRFKPCRSSLMKLSTIFSSLITSYTLLFVVNMLRCFNAAKQKKVNRLVKNSQALEILPFDGSCLYYTVSTRFVTDLVRCWLRDVAPISYYTYYTTLPFLEY